MLTTDETQSDVEEGFAAKNVMSLTQKKKQRDYVSDVIFEWPL